MIEENPTDRLRLLTRAAIVAAKGNTEAALERLDKTITQANDAALERTLTALYRTTALRALLATHYNELRAEGRVMQPRSETRIDTTNYDRTRERSTTWAARRVTQIEKNVVEERVAYEKQLLDRFYIDGKPLGDCTAAQARDRADRNERDAVFLRRVSSGVPDDGVIRDYLKPDEVERHWAYANDETQRPWRLFEGPTEGAAGRIWGWSMKGLKPKALNEATAMVPQLEALDDGTPATKGVRVALDMLARVIKEYEDAHA